MYDTLCINGWAQPANGLTSLAPDALHLDYQNCQNFTQTNALIAQTIPYVKQAIGWSLGGTILMEAMATGALKVQQLVLLAPPLQFVSTPDFPHGMDPVVFQQFYQNYRDSPQRTAERFTGLIAKGDRHAKRIMTELGAWEGSAAAHLWHPWLDTLNGQSFNRNSYAYMPKTLIVHGSRDVIVPLGQSEALARHCPQVTLEVWQDCAHAPHLHDLEALQQRIAQHAAQHGIT
ncbi:MAG: alpha/beta fold hydrolase [Rickettsiales bacterium]|nr:alpha/beta fold hydrolase [Rickettsiales bacterium]